MLRKTFRDGFTLVELSFSLLFIGILSIIIVLIINNTVVAWRRGLLLGQINNNGTELVDDMRVALQNPLKRSLVKSCERYSEVSGYPAFCAADGGYHLAFSEKVAQVTINGEEAWRPIYGVFCTGSYSYIWNSGYFKYDGASFDEKDNGWARLTYTVNGGTPVVVGGNEPFRLLKVKDEDRDVCMVAMGRNESGSFQYIYGAGDSVPNEYKVLATMETNNIEIEVQTEPEIEELLIDDNNNALALYNLVLTRPMESIDGQNMFYYAYFVLGTITNGANVTASGSTCVAPKEEESGSIDYCAINKFNFAVQVNGGYR